MSAEEMRRLGHAVVDLVVDRHCNRRKEPAILNGTPDDLRQRLGGPVPAEPGDVDEALSLLVDVALAHQQHGDHPRYFARVPGPSSFAAVLGDWLATGFNTIAASWAGGSGPSAVELIVVDWLRELTGLPAGTEGVLISGGSMANLTAIATARAVCGPGVAYLTDQTHSSIVRALHTLGFAEPEIRLLPSDDEYRMNVAELQRAADEDRRHGRRPMLVIANAGTTNTGAVDPLPELADFCASAGLWFHIDGAYGAPAAMTDAGRRLLVGIEHADSLVLDPHKWLFQPYDIGCTLVRRPGALERAFTMNPEYLKDVQASSSAEVDFRNRSLELTRRSRAIKLWLTFRAYGADRIRQGIERGIELAQQAEQLIRALPNTWELVTPAQLGIITFSGRNATKAQHDRAVQRVADSGFAAVTSTVLNTRSVLRLCTINPLTTEDDLRETLSRLAAAM
jgi:glutamate/tyrosine decarboxylase-like PLP-dependent enzyme